MYDNNSEGNGTNCASFSRYQQLVILVFLAYLVLGNIPRLGTFSRFAGFPATELLLYVVVLLGYLSRHVRLPTPLILLSLTFFFSWSIGFLAHNHAPVQEHAMAFLYCLRTVLILLVANYVGRALAQRFDYTGLKRLYIRLSMVQVTIAALIYIAFPSAVQLWYYLAQFGITFNGDPHIRRLMGSLFDPNFFGNLLVLPIIMVTVSVLYTKHRWAYVYLLVFVVALLMTYSRSSALGLVISLIVLTAVIVLGTRISSSNTLKRVMYLGMALMVLATIVVASSPEILHRFSDRFANISRDHSAIARLTSLNQAIACLDSGAYSLVGLGYNYIPYVGQRLGFLSGTGFDQSLLNLCISFGLPLTVLVVLFGSWWIWSALHNMRKEHPELYATLLALLPASLAMSFFNNLLFYPPYLISVLPLIAYGYWRPRPRSTGGAPCE